MHIYERKSVIAFFTVIVIVFVVFIFIKIKKERVKNYTIEKEIQELKDEAEKLVDVNKDLKQKIDYFQTDNYQEREAKSKLNLKKENEKTLIIKKTKDQEIFTEQIGSEKKVHTETEIEMQNYKRWLNLFFEEK